MKESTRWLGIIAPVFFVSVFTLEGWFRPSYSALQTEVSALSLGPHGWVQGINFVLTGGMLFLFANGLRGQFRQVQRSMTGPVLLMTMAICLLLSGPFVMDPPGTPRSAWTWHNWVHQLLGAVVFMLFPISCFIVSRTMRGRTAFRQWSRVAGWLIVAALIGMKLAQMQSADSFFALRLGLFQRIALITFLTWVFTLAVTVRQSANSPLMKNRQSL